MSDDPLELMAELRRESFRSAGLDWTVELYPQQWSRLHAAIKRQTDLAAERELELQMTVYSALEMLKEGNGMRPMAILSNRIDEIEGTLATHEHNEGEL